MSVKVKYNHIPKVVQRLPREVDKAVDRTGDEIASIARRLAPVRTGLLVRKTKGNGAGSMHAAVESGIYRGHAFYAGFLEFGANQPGGMAQPYMIPAAHIGERLFVKNVSDAVENACDV
jgi:hypothetical protein